MEKLIFRGQETFWEIRNGEWFCYITINKPFFLKGKEYFSISDKLTEACVKRNANLIAKVNNREFKLHPTKKTFKEKKKLGLIENVKSKFENYPDWHRLLYEYDNPQNKLL
jgi:hypothetical protein